MTTTASAVVVSPVALLTAVVLIAAALEGASGLQPGDPIDDAHLPSFFLVGGQKCGTSSMWSYIREHPQFVPPKRKETFMLNRYGEDRASPECAEKSRSATESID